MGLGSPLLDAPSTRAEIAELVLNNAREYAILVLDDDGVIVSWSPGAVALFGYDEAEAIGMPARDLFLPSDVAADLHRLELRLAREKGRAEDSRWHQRKDGGRFWGNGVTMLISGEGHSRFVKVVRDETRAKLADEQRILLLNELNHRVKNTLATVQSIAEQTLRSAGVESKTRNNLANRLVALSQAHDVLVQQSWAGADLHEIVDKALAPHGHPDRDNLRVDGPPVRLSPRQAVTLSLVLHELVTNAVKYGALTVTEGVIHLSWNTGIDGAGRRYLSMLWSESGGPVVSPPEHQGFGTRLIERTFASEEGGRATLSYDPEGVRCVIDLELSTPEEIPREFQNT